MMSQRIIGFRLRQQKIWHLNQLIDEKNAFGASSIDDLEDAIPTLVCEDDYNFFIQRFRNSVGTLEAIDGTLVYIVGDGGLQGTGEAPIFFLASFLKKITSWLLDVDMFRVTKPAIVTCAIFGGKVDGSISGFADDIFRKLPLPMQIPTSQRAEAAVDILKFSNQTYDEATTPYKQNMAKQEIVPVLGAHSQTKQFARMMADVQVGASARHLGGRYVWNGSNAEEIGRRLQAIVIAWIRMGEFWHSRAPWAYKRLVFISSVQSVAVTGLTSYNILSSEAARIDVQLVKLLRSMMRGKASDKTGVHIVALSNAQVFTHWRICPTEVELTALRIGWLQSMVRWPEAHEHIIACLWGQLRCEDRPTLDAHGQLSTSANPFAVRLATDMSELISTGMVEDFDEEWKLTGCSWISLFKDENVRVAFLKIDPMVVRIAFLHQHKQGGRPWDDAETEEISIAADAVPEFVCELKTATGETCSMIFPSLQQLRDHQAHARGGEHGVVSRFWKGVVTNQCPWCSSTFSTRGTAIAHCRGSYKNKRCIVDNSTFDWPLSVPGSLQCPFDCGFDTDMLKKLQAHLVHSHLPQPPPELHFQEPSSDAASSGGCGGRIYDASRRAWEKIRNRRCERHYGAGIFASSQSRQGRGEGQGQEQGPSREAEEEQDEGRPGECGNAPHDESSSLVHAEDAGTGGHGLRHDSGQDEKSRGHGDGEARSGVCSSVQNTGQEPRPWAASHLGLRRSPVGIGDQRRVHRSGQLAGSQNADVGIRGDGVASQGADDTVLPHREHVLGGPEADLDGG